MSAGCARKSRSISFSQIRAANVVALAQSFAGSLEQHLPPFHHIRVIGNLQRIIGILRRKQNRDAILGDSAYQLEDLVHHDRRQTKSRTVVCAVPLAAEISRKFVRDSDETWAASYWKTRPSEDFLPPS